MGNEKSSEIVYQRSTVQIIILSSPTSNSNTRLTTPPSESHINSNKNHSGGLLSTLSRFLPFSSPNPKPESVKEEESSRPEEEEYKPGEVNEMSARKSKSADKEEQQIEEMQVYEPAVDGVDDQEEEDDDEDGDGEYEVEAIVDHRQKKGAQVGNYEYLVSWKGYGSEHNTWEPEDHVSHASDIVSRYWSTRPKTAIPPKESKKRERPSQGGSSTPVPASQRKSAKTTATNGNSASSRRKSSQKQENGGVGDEDDEDVLDEFEISHVDSTSKYEDVADWEETVGSVDTIERSSQGHLMIYLTMVGGEKVAVQTDIAYKRCPQKVLQFYEKHLKWKSS